MKPAPYSLSLEPDDGPTATADNRRAWHRVSAAELPQISATLTTGPDIRLINISRGGALFESSKRLVPSSAVALRLVTPDGTHIVRGRVVRSRIVRLERGGLGYQAAIAFTETLQDLIEASPSTPPEAAGGSVPSIGAEEPAQGDADAAADGPIDESWAPIVTFTASVLHTSDELRELFNGNDW